MKILGIRWSILSLALTGMLSALYGFAEAQQPKRIPRIGILSDTGLPAQRPFGRACVSLGT